MPITEINTISADSLQGNPFNDPADREIVAIDVNSSDSSPILIGLAGFFGSNRSFQNRLYASMDFQSVLKEIEEKNKDTGFTVILPDTMTSMYGNQYLNSSAVGNYEDFITVDLVNFIKKKYGERNIGIFGRSSGWTVFDPSRNIEKRFDVLKEMAVFLQVGIHDEFNIDIGMKIMHEKLEKENIVHFYEEYDEGHFGTDYFYLKSIPLLAELLS